MRFATLHQERLLSLTACTSPTSFLDPHHQESADLIDREGVASWGGEHYHPPAGPGPGPPSPYPLVCGADVGNTRSRRQRIPAQRLGGLAAPVARVQTPTLILAAASLREEVLGDFRGAADLFPNGGW